RTSWGEAVLSKALRSLALRTEYWAATARMVREHWLLGVGPGNFGRHYPRYMTAAAFEKVQDPHNFALEIWATCGILTLVALLATLGLFFRRTLHSVLTAPERIADPRSSNPQSQLIRWDLYLGGMAGLILGFLLRAGDLSMDELVPEGIISGLRSLIW